MRSTNRKLLSQQRCWVIGLCNWKNCEHALKSYTKAIEKRLQTSNEYKTNSGLDRYDNAGKCLYVLKRFEEAITKSEIAKRIYNKIDHPLVTSTANWLGDCFTQLGEYDDVLWNFKEAIERGQQTSDDSRTDLMLALYRDNPGMCSLLYITEVKIGVLPIVVCIQPAKLRRSRSPGESPRHLKSR